MHQKMLYDDSLFLDTKDISFDMECLEVNHVGLRSAANGTHSEL